MIENNRRSLFRKEFNYALRDFLGRLANAIKEFDEESDTKVILEEIYEELSIDSGYATVAIEDKMVEG